MARLTEYSSKFKADVVLEFLTSGKKAEVVAAENNIYPTLLHNWKRFFLDHAYIVFEYAIKHNYDKKPKVTCDYMVRIRELREELGISQEQIAKLLGTSQTMYARYENGESKMPITKLVTLAQFYGVTTDYLVGLSDER